MCLVVLGCTSLHLDALGCMSVLPLGDLTWLNWLFGGSFVLWSLAASGLASTIEVKHQGQGLVLGDLPFGVQGLLLQSRLEAQGI